MLKSVFLLQMLSKTSVDEVFMHHFEKPSPGSCPWTLPGHFRPSAPIANPGKNPAVAHAL